MKNITKKEILTIINEKNKNSDIHWEVVENTNERIVITNDYCETNFNILFNQGNEEDIKIYDENMDNTIKYLLQGTDSYCDFVDVKEGTRKAIASVVRYFYYYY